MKVVKLTNEYVDFIFESINNINIINNIFWSMIISNFGAIK